MSLLDRQLAEPTDAEYISRVRGGDVEAYGPLFERHVAAARRLARALVPGPDSDDLVSDAFQKVLNVLLGGGGPDVAFRAYLLTAVRRLHVDKIRATRRATPTDDLTPYDPGVPFDDTVTAGFEGGAAAQAFASLPERWQLVLWHLEVEGQKPADIAPLLGMSANSVSALAYRAREGLRQAFLQRHSADVADMTNSACSSTREQLGAYVRHGLSRRDTDKVESHLEGCRKCTAVYLELSEVNSSLAAILGPLVLGTASAAYLAGGTAATGGLLGGVVAVLDRVKDGIAANSGAAMTAGVAAGVAVAATAGVMVVHSQANKTAPSARGTHPSISAPVTPTKRAVTKPAPATPAPTAPAVNTPAPTTPAATQPAAMPATNLPPPVVHKPAPAPAPSPAPSPGPPPVAATDYGIGVFTVTTTPGLIRSHSTVGFPVTGIPTGQSVVVELTIRGLHLLWSAPEQCRRTGLIPLRATCTVSAQHATLSTTFAHLLPVQFTATVLTPSGIEDSSPRNNSSSVIVKPAH